MSSKNIKNNKNRNRKKFQKQLKSGKVEKTFEVVTEKEFVQKDQWSGADEPMPDITLRDIEKSNRRKRKAEQEQQRQAEEERENLIKMTAAKSEEEKTKPKESEKQSRITVKSNENPTENSEQGDKPKKKKSGKSSQSDKSKVMDIKLARKKEKNKKRIKNIAVLLVVAVFAGTVYLTKDKWVPKLEGVLDKPHETIVNDGTTQKGNYPLSFDEGDVSAVSHIGNYLLCLDKTKLKIYNASGEEENSFDHNYADPVMKTAKKRILIYDNGGTSFMVANRKNEMYTKSVDDKILLADIANNNYTAVITEDDKYAAVLKIYDESGSEIYKWSSSSRVLSFSFSDDGTGCYVTTFSAKGGELKSVVRYMKFTSTEEVMKSEALGVLALEVARNDNGNFWVVGDTAFIKLDKDGNVISQYEYSSELVDYDLSSSCAALIFNGIQRNSTELMIFNSDSDSGEPDSTIYTDDGTPKSLYIEDSKIILLKDKLVESYDFSGNLLATAEASGDYVDFTYFDGSVYFLDYREINKITFST